MKIYVLIGLLLIVFTGYGQETTNLTVHESKSYRDSNGSAKILAMHTSPLGITAFIRASKKALHFDLFDVQLKKVHSKTIKIDKNEVYIGHVAFDHEIKLFTVLTKDKTNKLINCYVFDADTKRYKKKQLFKLKVKKKQRLFSHKKGHTRAAISPNGQYIAVATDNVEPNINAYTIRVYYAYTLNLLYQQKYQEKKNKYFEYNDLMIDDQAIVFVIGKSFISGKRQRKGGDANYTFILNRVSQDGDESIDIELNDLHIQSLRIALGDLHLNLLGFYSEKNINQIKGACNFKISIDDLSIIDRTFFDLPNDVYQDLYGTKKGKKKKGKELSNFTLDRIITDSQNNTYLIAEEFYETTNYVNNQIGGFANTEYHYDDLLILKFNADGALDWGRSIIKRDSRPSYNAFIKGNHLHIIFNSGKNLKEWSDGRVQVSKGLFESTALYDFEFDINGNVHRGKIQNNKGNTTYSPHYGTFENDRFIMKSWGKGNQRLMLLE